MWRATAPNNPEDAKSPAKRVRRALSSGVSGTILYFAIARPMLIKLSAITPRPTQRFMPASFL